MSRNPGPPQAVDDAARMIRPVPVAGSAAPARPIKGRYRLTARLGNSRLGVAYDAVDLLDRVAGVERHVMIQLLDASLIANRRFTGEFEQGVMSLRAISHPNLVGIVDAGCDDGRHFVVTELPGSGTLRFVLDDVGRLPLEETLAVIRAAGDALRYLHAKSIVHGNLKPDNVLVTFDYEVKLLDVVPPAWIPAAEGRPDPRDDVFGLACLAYEMLSGRHPFNALTAEEAEHAGLRAAVLAELPAARWRALAAALEPDRALRTATIAQFLDDFGVTGDERLRAMVAEDPDAAVAATAPARTAEPAPVLPGSPLPVRALSPAMPRTRATGRLLTLLLLAALGAFVYHDSDRVREAAVAAMESVAAAVGGPVRPDPARSPPVAAAPPDPAPRPSIAAPVAAPAGPAEAAASVPARPGPERFSLGQPVLAVREDEVAARIVIRRSGDTARPAAIVWWTAAGSAIADRDFIDLGRRVERFQPGEERRTIFVPLANDRDPEPVRSFNVYLGRVTDAEPIVPLSGMRVDIIDDD